MNRLNFFQNKVFRRLLLIFCFSVLSYFALFVLLSYVFFQLPNFEDYDSTFPIVLLLLEGLLIGSFTQKFFGGAIVDSFVGAFSVSLIGLLVGIWKFGLSGSILKAVVLYLLFMVGTVLFQVFLQRKPSKKRRQKAPFKR